MLLQSIFRISLQILLQISLAVLILLGILAVSVGASEFPPLPSNAVEILIRPAACSSGNYFIMVVYDLDEVPEDFERVSYFSLDDALIAVALYNAPGKVLSHIAMRNSAGGVDHYVIRNPYEDLKHIPSLCSIVDQQAGF